MEVTGSGGQLTFSEVKVVGLENKCTVEDPAEPVPDTVITKPLEFTTTSSAGATLKPIAPSTLLAEFNIVSKPGQSCPFAGLIRITGTAPATLSGSTLKANITKASGFLKINEEKASLTIEETVLGGLTETPTEASKHHAVSLTTTTP